MFPVSFAAVVGVGGGERGLPDKTKQRLLRKLGVLHIKPDIFHVVSKQICILYLVFQQTYSQKNKLRIFLSDRNKKEEEAGVILTCVQFHARCTKQFPVQYQ